MQFTTVLAALLSASLATTAPTTSIKPMATSNTPWTVKSLRRICNGADTECKWTFGIDTHQTTGDNEPTSCTYTVKGDPASRTDGGVSPCGPFTVSSGYNDQAGDDQGFTVLAIAHPTKKLIIWAAYTEEQLEGGKLVSPDQTHEPATIA